MLPDETIRAIFPVGVKVGEIAAGPLTLRRAAAMEALGIDASDPEGRGIGERNALLALWVLSASSSDLALAATGGPNAEDAFDMWARNYAFGDAGLMPETAASAVRRAFRAAWAAYVPAKRPKGEIATCIERGYGWPLSYAEAFAHEYSVSLDEALDMPMCRLFAMIACARSRNGGENGGPDYCERASLLKIKNIDAALQNGVGRHGGE